MRVVKDQLHDEGMMMTSPVSSTSSAWFADATQQSTSVSSLRTTVLTAVAGELGISEDQLQADLQTGKSLTQVAQAAGVSSAQLNQTITTALNGATLPTGTNVNALADRIANFSGGHHGHHHGGGSAPVATTTSSTSTTSDVLGALATLTGSSTSDSSADSASTNSDATASAFTEYLNPDGSFDAYL
jgi:hypothetical protein